MFKSLYPSPHTGAPLRFKDHDDWMGVKGNESRLVRCRFCGFICDRERDLIIRDGSFAGKGVSYGSQQTTSAYTVGGKSVTDYYYEPVAAGGCPQCYSFRYAEKKGGKGG